VKQALSLAKQPRGAVDQAQRQQLDTYRAACEPF
jgi:hypothetical protein